VLPFLKPILAPAAKIAKEKLLPAAIGALSSGDTAALKQAFLQTIKEATPGVLDRASQTGIQQLQQVIPHGYQATLTPALQNISQAGQQLANQKIDQWTGSSGNGLRKTKARKKKIDQLVSGSGLLKYN
jgi:triphosphoribosyl-dephospho-CoA synthetase